MTVLWLIWWLAALLATLAVGWMLTLIGLREVHETRRAERLTLQRKTRRQLLDVALGPSETLIWDRRDVNSLAVLAAYLAELAELIKGPEMERLSGVLRASGLYRRLLRLARRGDPDGRLVFIEAMAAMPGRETVRILNTIANEPLPQVSLAAYRTLWLMGHEVTIEDVQRDAETRDGATLDRLELTGQIGEAHPQRALPWILNEAANEAVRVRLIDSVADADWPPGDEALHQLAADSASPNVRAAALRALAQVRRPGLGRVLSEGVASEDWQVRAEAARAIGACERRDLAEPLGLLLGDENWAVRFNAGSALSKLGPAGQAIIAEVAARGHPRARRTAELLIQTQGLAA
ncbi:MAG: HEAT repeat domain-containing protein [Caulobacterales bacterium]|nr:HEAT repeat domain-containing protein [Caulobacterales bacterium]